MLQSDMVIRGYEDVFRDIADWSKTGRKLVLDRSASVALVSAAKIVVLRLILRRTLCLEPPQFPCSRQSRMLLKLRASRSATSRTGLRWFLLIFTA